jgi:peroxiredoxin
MKNLILLPALFLTLFSAASCHVSTTTAKTQDTIATHPMLYPDANTTYYDEAGHKMPVKDFADSIKSGKYSFQPVIKDGKIATLTLKKASVKLKAGTAAPDFSLTDINGKTYTLAGLKGKTVIMNFWFTSCAPCLQEIPDLNTLVDKYKDDKSVVFIAVTYVAAPEVKQFLTKKPFKFNIVADQGEFIKKLGITGYPTSLVIDKNGGIAFILSTYDGTNVQQLDGVIGALKSM